jgi:hypothetical protein
MSSLIDVIGSYVIGGMILLMLINVNSSVNNAALENLYSGVMQRNVTSTSELIENDIYKIGYRISGNRFSIADSNQINFSADIDNNGTPDIVYYYCGNKSELNGTSNPNDFVLKRVINGVNPGTQSTVSDFKLSYFDSLGQKLDYASLKTQLGMNKIRSLKVYLKCETQELINDHYEAAEWEKTILPKNI